MNGVDVTAGFRQSVLLPLRAAGRTLRRRIVLEGACRCVAVLVAAAFVQFALDKLLVLGAGPRAALLLALLALMARNLWRYVIRPFALRIDAEDVARILERRHPPLKDILISAVSFATRPAPADSSLAMRSNVIRDCQQRVRAIPFGPNIRRDRHRKFLATGLVAISVAGIAAIWQPDTFATYLARNFALQDVAWPSGTELWIQGFANGKLRWPVGDPLTLVVTASGRIPRGLRAEFEASSGAGLTRDMALRGREQFVVDYGPLQQSMKVRFLIWKLGVDERTEWHDIEAIERPSIAGARVQITPPPYSRQEPYTLAAGQTGADILRSSAVRIEATTNKPVVEASLRSADRVVAPADLLSATQIVSAFEPSHSGTFYFALRDADGLDDLRPVTYSLRLLSDPAPRVRLTLPGAGEMLVAAAVLPLVVDCEDNLGIRSIDLMIRPSRLKDSGDTRPDDSMTEPLPGLVAGQTNYTQERSWPLLPLTLQPGDELSMWVRAADDQPGAALSTATAPSGTEPAAPPSVGQSQVYTFRIVTPQELLAELSRRENEWRREFEGVIQAQERLNTRIMDIHDQAAAATSEALSTRFAQEARAQRQIANRIGVISRQFEQLLAERQINQLEDATIRRRLDRGVIRPLAGIAASDIPQISEVMDRLRERFDPAEAESLETAQKRLLARMYEVLANMLKWEGYEEAVALLRDIIRLQGDLNRDTRQQMQKEIESLLGESATTQPEGR
jgi:hypothetical protein